MFCLCYRKPALFRMEVLQLYNRFFSFPFKKGLQLGRVVGPWCNQAILLGCLGACSTLCAGQWTTTWNFKNCRIWGEIHPWPACMSKPFTPGAIY